MKRQIVALWLICLCASYIVTAQQNEQPVKHSYVVIPPEIALPVIASQPECPVQFEKVRFLRDVKGGGGNAFELRNHSTKPISSVTFAMLNSLAGGWMDSWPRTLNAPLVMPGELVPLNGEDEQEVIIPLTKELRDKLKLRGPMQVIAVFMVVKVKFADGSVYDDEKTYKALEAYFEKIQ